MKVYIAGAISGLPGWRVKDDFNRGKKKIKAHNSKWDVISPLEIKPADHPAEEECPPGRIGMHGHNEGCHLKADLRILLVCDAILLLDGWERSWGASLELSVARATGLQILLEREL